MSASRDGILVGGAAQHHAIDMGQMRLGLVQGLDAAIEDDLQGRILALDAIDQIIIQRRHVAVFLRRQALQPGLARMHGEARHARRGARRDQGAQTFFGILVVHADAAFDGDGHGHRFAHGRHAIGDQLRLLHQAGAKAAGLHPVGRTADIEIDFVIAEIFGDARCFGQRRRVGAAQLQRHRMFRSYRIPAAACDRRAEPRPPSPFRCRAGRGASAARCSTRQCVSVQSIIGAMAKTFPGWLQATNLSGET